MLFLLLAITLLCLANGCPPFINNGTVEYEYFKVLASGDHNINKIPVEPKDGRYPDGTFARMLCKNVAEKDRATDKEVVGQCSSGNWEINNSSNFICPSRGCEPLVENDSEWYDYVKNQNHKHIGNDRASMEWDGKYPKGTYAKRFCKQVDSDSIAQDKDIVAECVSTEWQYYKVSACPPPGSCAPYDASRKLKFTSVKYDFKNVTIVYTKPHTNENILGAGSKISVSCRNGPWKTLVCTVGYWLQGRFRKQVECSS